LEQICFGPAYLENVILPRPAHTQKRVHANEFQSYTIERHKSKTTSRTDILQEHPCSSTQTHTPKHNSTPINTRWIERKMNRKETLYTKKKKNKPQNKNKEDRRKAERRD
jgi:hypothetical protein